jgi:isovaleryl-CoA dehydrogenase
MMIREAAGRFADEQVMPLAAEIDREDRFARELWEPMGALGLHGITVEEEWGGLGLGYLDHTIAVEESVPRIGRRRPVLRRAFQPVRQPDPPLGQ